MARFTLPRDIYWGKNALENLATFKGKRAVLVLGGGSMKRGGFVDRAVEYLKQAGIETTLIEGVEPDPSVETVMRGASAAYSTASQASDLRTQIADARTTGESLAVQESLLSSPSNIRTQADEKLKMQAGVSSETITLSVDPVSIDSAGNLSFAGSVSRITSQG